MNGLDIQAIARNFVFIRFKRLNSVDREDAEHAYSLGYVEGLQTSEIEARRMGRVCVQNYINQLEAYTSRACELTIEKHPQHLPPDHLAICDYIYDGLTHKQKIIVTLLNEGETVARIAQLVGSCREIVYREIRKIKKGIK